MWKILYSTLFILAGAAACNAASRSAEASTSAFPETAPIGQTIGVQLKPWHTSDDDLARIHQAGFGLVRWGISWDAVEKSPGVYDWSVPDAFFKRLRANHLRSVIILGQGNPLYTGTTDNHDKMTGQARQPLPPRRAQDVALFARFAAAAAQRYADDKVVWEIWNEPDLSRFWPPESSPGDYAALASAACVAIKGADSGATVIGPGGAAMPDTVRALAPSLLGSLASSPAAACLDAVSAHDYRMHAGQPIPTPESVADDNARSIQWLDANFKARPMPLVCSEWGFAEPLVSARQQADYPLRAALSNLLSHVPVTILYEWKDSNRRDPSNPESHYGLLDYDGGEKDGFQKLDAVLPKISDATLVGRKPVGQDGVYAVVVRQPSGAYGLVYWRTEQARAQALAAGSQDLTLSTAPAYADLGGAIPTFTLR